MAEQDGVDKDRTLGIGLSEKTFHLYRCLHTVPGVGLEAIVIACYRNFEFSDFHLRNEFWFDIRPANTRYESEKPASGQKIQRQGQPAVGLFRAIRPEGWRSCEKAEKGVSP